jgi:hypothetical protein
VALRVAGLNQPDDPAEELAALRVKLHLGPDLAAGSGDDAGLGLAAPVVDGLPLPTGDSAGAVDPAPTTTTSAPSDAQRFIVPPPTFVLRR